MEDEKNQLPFLILGNRRGKGCLYRFYKSEFDLKINVALAKIVCTPNVALTFYFKVET